MTEDENKYQLGIRKLSNEDLVNLVLAYRNKLMGCRALCRDFAEENFAQHPLHKIVCANMAADLRVNIEDYKWAIREVTRGGK